MPPMDANLAKIDRPQRRPAHLPGCDFFCLRFQVWYASTDCAYRTRFQTYEGCGNCDQGRFNLKRHRQDTSRRRWALPLLAPGQE